MDTKQKTVFQVLTSYIPGIDQSKLQHWLEFKTDGYHDLGEGYRWYEKQDPPNPNFFFFADMLLADVCFDNEELEQTDGFFFQGDDLDKYWEIFYTNDGSKLYDDHDYDGDDSDGDGNLDDPRLDFNAGVIDMSNHTYLRLNGYGDYYEFNLNESDPRKKDLNPDFTDWIKNG